MANARQFSTSKLDKAKAAVRSHYLILDSYTLPQNFSFDMYCLTS